jgi:hypothetical protein
MKETDGIYHMTYLFFSLFVPYIICCKLTIHVSRTIHLSFFSLSILSSSPSFHCSGQPPPWSLHDMLVIDKPATEEFVVNRYQIEWRTGCLAIGRCTGCLDMQQTELTVSIERCPPQPHELCGAAHPARPAAVAPSTVFLLDRRWTAWVCIASTQWVNARYTTNQRAHNRPTCTQQIDQLSKHSK